MTKLGIVVAALAAMISLPASANDTVRFGKGHPTAFAFLPVEVGAQEGIFARHGIDVKIFGFRGAGKFHQAIAAGSIDMGAASGPDMIFVAKGSPAKAVANLVGPPIEIAIGVRYDSPIKTLADLKGKSIGVTTHGSLTWWLPRHLAEMQGWGPDGVKTVELTSTPGMVAGLRTKQVDAISTGADTIFLLEKNKQGRLLLDYGDYVKDFMTHVMYASNDFIAHHPDDVRKVIAAWFDTIDWMKSHKDRVVNIYFKESKIPPDIGTRTFDLEMPMFTTDGHFVDSQLKALAKSYVQMGEVDKEPDMRKLLTEKFLPPKKSGS